MKLSKKAWLGTIAAGALAMGMMGASSADAAAQYKGTFYVAGMGGHFAKAEVEIDPAAEQPITVQSLDMVEIGDGKSHPVHDARIDVNNRNNMFWSTYKIDEKTNKTHVGMTDLTTGEKAMDVDVDVPPEATNTKSMYCASAQAKDYFLPISMSNKGYIDVFQKSDLKMVRRMFLEGTEADPGKPYKYFHGVNSPDMKKLLITINESDTDHGNIVGKLHLVMVDMDEFVNGNVKVLAKNIAVGAEKKTISFRQYFSNDGTKIANATGDRLLILDANTLETLDAEMVGSTNETHDSIFTPDDKYVVLTLRNKRALESCADPNNPKDDEYLMDGTLALYDVAAGKLVGKATSVCLACHDQEGLDVHAVLCGLDTNWTNI